MQCLLSRVLVLSHVSWLSCSWPVQRAAMWWYVDELGFRRPSLHASLTTSSASPGSPPTLQ